MRPRWPVRLPARGGADRALRVRGGVAERLIHVGPSPVRLLAWRGAGATARLRAEAVAPAEVAYPAGCAGPGERPPAGEAELETAIARWRFALALDDDMGGFFRRFRSDPLLGRVISRRPWARPRRRPWPWEALAWAITEQLIESPRAKAIQRRLIGRWGSSTAPAAAPTSPRRVPGGGDPRLFDLPPAELVAGRAPAELVGMDLTEARSLAMVRCAREVAAGRADLEDPACDRRLLAIREIGPWTVQCLAYYGRGDPDALPAGDLAYIKLVGHLGGLGRRATVAEVEEYFAPYAPYRGLAGTFALAGHHRAVAQGPPLRRAA